MMMVEDRSHTATNRGLPRRRRANGNRAGRSYLARVAAGEWNAAAVLPMFEAHLVDKVRQMEKAGANRAQTDGVRRRRMGGHDARCRAGWSN